MKKLSLYDLAMQNIRSEQKTCKPVQVEEGDMVTVLEPWVAGENYSGLVINVTTDNMTIYDNKYQRKITWPKCVKCTILKL